MVERVVVVVELDGGGGTAVGVGVFVVVGVDGGGTAAVEVVVVGGLAVVLVTTGIASQAVNPAAAATKTRAWAILESWCLVICEGVCYEP